jgi:Tol biopolymer transport system component
MTLFVQVGGAESARPATPVPIPDVIVMKADGSDMRDLTNSPSWDDAPAWSPDGSSPTGSKIAYSGDLHIIVMNADGTDPYQLTQGDNQDYDPAWSPDGRKIAFARAFANENYSQRDIVVMNKDGSDPVNLTNTSVVDEVNPTWSPDGTRIAFSRGTLGGTDIYSMRADGTDLRRLTSDPLPDITPAWSPDGTKIAFARAEDDAQREAANIFVVNADGSGERNLTNDNGWSVSPTWSPDGTRIAFSRNKYPFPGIYDPDIFVMNADGSGLVDLSPSERYYDQEPAWSPDGRRIAFARSDDSGPSGHPPPPPPPPASRPPPPAPSPPARCHVPRVVGRRLAVARARIRRAKCSVGRTRWARSSKPGGRVIHQSPRPGTTLRRSGRVSLLVSRGQR